MRFNLEKGEPLKICDGIHDYSTVKVNISYVEAIDLPTTSYTFTNTSDFVIFSPNYGFKKATLTTHHNRGLNLKLENVGNKEKLALISNWGNYYYHYYHDGNINIATNHSIYNDKLVENGYIFTYGVTQCGSSYSLLEDSKVFIDPKDIMSDRDVRFILDDLRKSYDRRLEIKVGKEFFNQPSLNNYKSVNIWGISYGYIGILNNIIPAYDNSGKLHLFSQALNETKTFEDRLFNYFKIEKSINGYVGCLSDESNQCVKFYTIIPGSSTYDNSNLHPYYYYMENMYDSFHNMKVNVNFKDFEELKQEVRDLKGEMVKYRLGINLSLGRNEDLEGKVKGLKVELKQIQSIIDQVRNETIKGEKGDQGPRGLSGQRGERGIAGSPGPQGLPGVDGIPGLPGRDGKTGIPGISGPQGLKGASGAPGLPGIPGERGLDGNPGGPKGDMGPRGPKGDRGASGKDGREGLIGFPGIKGDKGEAGGQKGEQGTPGVSVQGSPGLPGVPGKSGSPGKKGDIGPVGPKGPEGKKGDKGWKGEKGKLGVTGKQGVPGLPGTSGRDGIPGLPGPQGLKGDRGASGEKGDKGDTGPVGPKGPEGKKGDRGWKGEKGKPGVTGKQGVPGLPGTSGRGGLSGKKGDKGDTGPVGPKGPEGKKGDKGWKGDKGDEGNDGLPGKSVDPKEIVDELTTDKLPILKELMLNATDANGDTLIGKLADNPGLQTKIAQNLLNDKATIYEILEYRDEDGNLLLEQQVMGSLIDNKSFHREVANSLFYDKNQELVDSLVANVDQDGKTLVKKLASDAEFTQSITKELSHNPGKIQGPKGETGAPGLKGRTGVHGLPGAKGDQGPKGERGDIGLPGKDGSSGEKGDKGNTGPVGPKGETGAPGTDGLPGRAGIPGPQGLKGASGAPGQPGTPGRDGLDGRPGPRGPEGPKGETGAPGLKGRTGAHGLPGADGLNAKVADQFLSKMNQTRIEIQNVQKEVEANKNASESFAKEAQDAKNETKLLYNDVVKLNNMTEIAREKAKEFAEEALQSSQNAEAFSSDMKEIFCKIEPTDQVCIVSRRKREIKKGCYNPLISSGANKPTSFISNVINFFYPTVGEDKYKLENKIQELEQAAKAVDVAEIVRKFEKVLQKTAKNCSMQSLNFNPIELQSIIMDKQLLNDDSKLLKTLLTAAKEACPNCPNKFSSLFENHMRKVLADSSKFKSPVDIKKVSIDNEQPRSFIDNAIVTNLSNVYAIDGMPARRLN